MKVLPLFAAATCLASLPVPAGARTIAVAPGPNAQQRLQTALIDTRPGDTVRLAAGRYALVDGLSLDVANVTVTGAGADRTILDFAGQKGEGEGLLITANGALVRDLAVHDSKGNGIKAKGVDGISFVRVSTEWTHGPKPTNGAYGVYPVSSSNVLIDHVFVRGAADAGIYVGQSKNIVVRDSRAEGNVAGIEIENSFNADVFGNTATGNAGGILVFDLPNLPQQGGHAVRLFKNQVIANNGVNFAAAGNIVASVPSGTGVMVMANRDVHVFDNDITGNNGNAIMIVAYREAFTDKSYNPLPRDVAVRGNRMAGNGGKPGFPGGAELAQAVGGTLPPVMWDGVTSYKRADGKPVEGDGRIAINDLPLLNLNLPTAGAPVSAAKPEVATVAPMMTLPEPPAVVLPAAQEARARAK